MGSKKRKIHFKKALREANIKKCLFADQTGCGGTIIKAHSIQNNRILNNLSENGELYMFEPAFVDFGDAKLQKVGKAKATTFTGFCAKHDNDVFLPIENRDYIPGDAEQECLYAYRAFAKEWHAKLVAVKLIEDTHAEAGYTTPETEALLAGNLLALEDIEKEAKIFEVILLQNQYQKLETKVLIFDQPSEFSVSSALTVPYDFEGKELPHFTKTAWVNPAQLYLTVFPQGGKTYALLSYYKEAASIFSFLKEQLVTKPEARQKELLTRLIVHGCENIVFSPRMVERKGEKFALNLADAFAKTTTVHVEESILDKELEFSLFD